ncbi:MAG: sigma-70 family RNA polymerase sigma factor [Gemmatimonadales bacterium]|nr:sigma-70 family RNA polymerase sigma factor [Gemmatimonadales bacterium]
MTPPRPALRVVQDGRSGVDPEEPGPDGEVSRALSDLINRFDGFIRRTADRHGLSGADVDEVVQDLRIRIWKAFGTSELIRRAKSTYLYRAAISASLDIIRRRRTIAGRAASFDDPSPPRVETRGIGAQERLEAADLSVAVHEALGLIQESRRAVVRMYLAGYDRFEIADLLGWTEAKVRNLLYRGLQDLREILRGRGITGGPEA